MQKPKLFFRKTLTLFLAMVLTFGAAVSLLGTYEAAAASASYKSKTIKKNGLDYGYEFTGTSGAINGMKGTCADAWHHTGNGTATITKIPNNHPMARLAYYCEVKGYSVSSTAKLYGYSRSNVIAHAMQYANCKTGYKISKSVSQWKSEMKSQGATNGAINAGIKLYDNAQSYASTTPDNFEVYYLNVNGSHQDGVVWKLTPAGNATIRKVSSDASVATIPGYNSFAGVTYGLYKADKATLVGTFTLNANGTANTITGLTPGTYYVKETATNDYYQIDDSWHAITVYSNNTASVTLTDAPKKGTARIIKKEANGHDIRSDASFTFHLVHKDNPSITYDLTVTGNNTPTASGTLEVMAGTYTVTETDYPDNWEDATGSMEITVTPGQTAEIEWTNRQPGEGRLSVKKVTEDNGPLAGFTFRVEGILYNQGEMTAARLIEAANPSVTITNAEDYESLGNWTVNSSDLTALNNAAKNRENGNYTVRLTNTARHKTVESTTALAIVEAIENVPDNPPASGTVSEGTAVKIGDVIYKATADISFDLVYGQDAETGDYMFDKDATVTALETLIKSSSDVEEIDVSDIDISISVIVALKDVEWSNDDEEFVDPVRNKTSQNGSGTGYTLTYNNFDWHGAATIYKDLGTGRSYTILTTNNYGLTDTIERGVSKGKFTVTEEMTDLQRSRYHQPESQTQEVLEGEFASFSFEFTNTPYWTPVKLKKISADGNIANIEFKLSGTTAFGESVSMTRVTDEDGNLDFGMIHKGSYVIEETSFDSNNYLNTHRLPGYENPAVTLEVTGEETEDILIDFENTPIATLYISKIDGESHDFLENAIFELYEDGELAARFQIVRNDDGSAGVNMLWSNGVISGHMSKTVPDPDDGSDDVADESTVIDSDDDVIVVNPDAESESGGDSSGDDSQSGGDSSIDYNSLNWARLDNLSLNKTYLLKETKAPAGGYIATGTVEFVMDDISKRIVVENFIPEIGTTASDSETGSHIANADSSVTIIDKVTYKHLVPNTEYILKGYLLRIDDNTGAITKTSPVMSNGSPVEVSKTVTSDEDGTGEWEMEFTFDASDLKGYTTVVCEELYTTDNSLVALHGDPDDEGQSIHFPEIGTTAKDPNSQYNDLGSISETQTITDTVEYTNLETGASYVMRGMLFDKNTNEYIMNAEGQIYTAEKTFVPTETSGTVDMTFTVDSRDLISHQIVAFEECYYDTGTELILVASHRDHNDEAQTIVYPAPSYDMYKIRTTDASEKYKTGKYGFKAGDQVFYEVHVINKGNVPITMDIRDTFNEDCKDLFTLPVVEKVENATQNSISEDKNVVNITIEIGETAVITYSAEPVPAAPEYLAAAKGDSDSEDLEGNDVNLVDEKNSPDNKDGYVNTAYTENPTFPNPGNPDELLPVPEGDKNDVAQTPIREPEIGTTLTSNGKKEVAANKATKLVDSVQCIGLTPGQKYAVVGTLMVKETGKELKENSEEFTLFTPSTENGITKVNFTVDTNQLKGKNLVAFETCYNVTGLTDEELDSVNTIVEKGVKVAEHKDINDKDQTVKIKTTPKTGDTHSAMILTSVLIAAIIAAVALKLKRN